MILYNYNNGIVNTMISYKYLLYYVLYDNGSINILYYKYSIDYIVLIIYIYIYTRIVL